MPIPDPQALILPILKALSPGGATLLSNVRRRKELTRLSWLGHKEDQCRGPLAAGAQPSQARGDARLDRLFERPFVLLELTALDALAQRHQKDCTLAGGVG